MDWQLFARIYLSKDIAMDESGCTFTVTGLLRQAGAAAVITDMASYIMLLVGPVSLSILYACANLVFSFGRSPTRTGTSTSRATLKPSTSRPCLTSAWTRNCGRGWSRDSRGTCWLLLFALDLAQSKNPPTFCPGTFHLYLTQFLS
jgi:hypothetical protein